MFFSEYKLIIFSTAIRNSYVIKDWNNYAKMDLLLFTNPPDFEGGAFKELIREKSMQEMEGKGYC